MTLFRGLKFLPLSAVLVMAACATTAPAPEDIAVLRSQDSVIVSQDSAQDQDYSQYISSERVQVFSLNGPSPDVVDNDSALYGSGRQSGYAYGGDSRVIVYGLEDARPRMGTPNNRAIMPLASGMERFDPAEQKFGNGVQETGASAAYPAAYGRTGAALLGKVYFAHDSSRLDSTDQALIDQVVAQAVQNPGAAVVVEGHASRRAATNDPVGRHVVNLKASLDRAYQVSRTLMEKGVPAESVRTVGLGDTQAEASEESSRRVEIYQTTQR